ncbi:MAG: hypothetical protein H6709_16910 [Kofleriaceae bacterium]|nr:hypothetical protein [Myxococcales bacterium]MCB9564650.1 hypothetical protein [Kofleriaceae bacterium]MCB9573762.1 hypothetical protein [Kofleriaceae bacterium]
MTTRGDSGPSIWWWAFGYFAAYAPYAALTKAITSGLLGDGRAPPTGVELLPISVAATVTTAILFLWLTGWWRHARKPVGRWQVPLPSKLTALSGLCSAGIIATTTLAYTFEGVSIVYVMLLMRGGLLMMAPGIDALTGRKIAWYSLVALALSAAALATAVSGAGGFAISRACAIDIALYLFCYFVRLQLMSRKAKSTEPGANLRYFVEEQLVSSPVLLLGLVVWASVGSGAFAHELHTGFTTFLDRPEWAWAILIGVMSQGTGIFGGLILLDKRENTFCVPVNRASSVLAGVIATTAVWQIFGGKHPRGTELLGAAIMIGAILVLSLGGLHAKGRARSRTP